MARYWGATTFKGFYVEGRNQEQTLANHLSGALGGRESDPIMGAGIYVWLEGQEDPSIRVKDLGDRTLVELVVVDRTVLPALKSRPASEEGEASRPESPTGGPLEDLRMRVDGILGGLHARVDTTPAEYHTRLDLKLEKWQRPTPMAIASGAPSSFSGEIGPSSMKGGRGGIGGIIAMLLALIVLGGAGYYMITTAGNDPYYIFRPGTQVEQYGEAFGFNNTVLGRLVTIMVSAQIDTLGRAPRFVRAEEDTATAYDFLAEQVMDLRVDGERRASIVLVPAAPPSPSTASLLDVASQTWNRAEVWLDWFASEINRGLIEGVLVRQDDALWLRAGANLVQLQLSGLLTDTERIKLDWAEAQGLQVLLEIRFMESLPINRVRTRTSNKLFSAEVRQIHLVK